MTSLEPIVLRGLRRDTLGTLWTLRDDGLWESTVNGAVFPLAEVDDGPCGPTREVTLAGDHSGCLAAEAEVATELAEERTLHQQTLAAQEQSRADVRIVVPQRIHAHTRPGIWDDDNRPEKAGKPCVECAAHARLLAWADGVSS